MTGGQRPHEIELSVDETDRPTTLAEHDIVAHRCLDQGMAMVSLAPRFVGAFEKGVDYIGDLGRLGADLRDHASLAAMVGPCKLGLHSGSDKLSMYGAMATATQNRSHVKTAGTSYLEALRVVARHDADAFLRLCEFARERYDSDKATYHVHATLHMAPALTQRAGRRQRGGTRLPGTLGRRAGREGIHGAGAPDPALHVWLGAHASGTR
jgi:hypothetical protein